MLRCHPLTRFTSHTPLCDSGDVGNEMGELTLLFRVAMEGPLASACASVVRSRH